VTETTLQYAGLFWFSTPPLWLTFNQTGSGTEEMSMSPHVKMIIELLAPQPVGEAAYEDEDRDAEEQGDYSKYGAVVHSRIDEPDQNYVWEGDHSLFSYPFE
jgi:hypothetical protein